MTIDISTIYLDPCKGHGRIIHGNEGVIDYYNNYGNNVNCSWYVAASEDADQVYLFHIIYKSGC